MTNFKERSCLLNMKKGSISVLNIYHLGGIKLSVYFAVFNFRLLGSFSESLVHLIMSDLLVQMQRPVLHFPKNSSSPSLQDRFEAIWQQELGVG